jgi:hypothetical protein
MIFKCYAGQIYFKFLSPGAHCRVNAIDERLRQSSIENSPAREYMTSPVANHPRRRKKSGYLPLAKNIFPKVFSSDTK